MKRALIQGVYGMVKRWINPNDYIRMKIQPMDLSMGKINIHGKN
jgi:translation initiation factor IF-1